MNTERPIDTALTLPAVLDAAAVRPPDVVAQVADVLEQRRRPARRAYDGRWIERRGTTSLETKDIR